MVLPLPGRYRPWLSVVAHPVLASNPLNASMSFKKVLTNGQQFIDTYPRSSRVWNFFSRVTLGTVGLYAKVFISVKHRHKITNRDILFEAIKQSKLEGRGLITVMNHVSTLDDPLVWGVLPLSDLVQPTHVRWTLGADNICFKNKITSTIFSLGQVLSTRRFGAGPFQNAIDSAVYLLSKDSPEWVHIFPEGFVHQPFEPFENTMKYFKWGVSRMILEAKKPPIVVPIYAHGLQEVFPEHRKTILGYNTKNTLRYRIGDPFDRTSIEAFRQEWQDLAKGYDQDGYVPDELQNGQEAKDLRSRVAAFSRMKVLQVRRDMGFQEEGLPNLGDPAFWTQNATVNTVRLRGITLEQKRQSAGSAKEKE